MKNETNYLTDDKNRIKANELWVCYYETKDYQIECDLFTMETIYGYPFDKENYSSQKAIKKKEAYYFTQCEGNVTLIEIYDVNVFRGEDYSYCMNPGDILLEIEVNNFNKWKKHKCTNFLYEYKYFLDLVDEINEKLPPEERIEISPYNNKTISYDQYNQIKQYIKLENRKEQQKVLKHN